MLKLNRLQKIIVAVLAFFLALGILLQALQGSTMSNLGYDMVSMLKYGLVNYPMKTLKGWLKDFETLWSAKEENDQLRYELSQVPYYKALYEDTLRENEELRKALDLTSKEQQVVVHAEVVGRSQDNWNNTVTINKGKKDGIKENMAVETTEGMIGRIESVSTYTSIVKLLTSEDKQSNASIKINLDEKHSSEGILSNYDVKKGVYIVYLYNDSDEIKKGMQVVTSGKGGVYPSGLLIGTVESVQALNNQTGQTIYVRPVSDFQEFNVVRVIGIQSEE